MSSYTDMMAAATAAIDAHNEKAGDNKVDVDAFQGGLAGLGGTTAEALRMITWEDLQALGLPTLIARQIARILRKEDKADGGDEKKAKRITAKNAPEVSEEELVAVYDPSRPNTPAAREMDTRSGNRRFVVFDRDGGVHRKATAECLRELVDGEPEREYYKVGGVPQPVFRVGERPDRTADEHPLCRGVALRSDGTCRLGLNWTDGISLEVRRLLWIAVHETRELQIDDDDRIHDTHERARRDDALEVIRSRYPKASVRYAELEGRGELPSLKVSKTSSGGGRRRGGDPFHGESRHVRS